ncbi:MAG TPA: NAD(P)H-dependent oxidoreductase [Burkholderiales bacterium]|nr:NAD(P)H-dependent oxidoreductase [Burkholderiales bacterium]
MTKNLLQVNASLFSGAGQSSVLANEFVAGWRARNPGAMVTVRDLAQDPVPHLTAERFQAFVTKPEDRSADQRAEAAYSDALINELKRAHVIVLGVPMYNFDVPSTLKAYFDHIARAGSTFNYAAQGPVGLLTDKKVYIFASRGGIYAGNPHDTQSAYLRNFLGLLGITDIEIVYAEGLAVSDASKQTALTRARNTIVRLHAAGDAREPLAA